METQQEINEILRLAGLPPQLDEAAPAAKRLIPMFQNLIKISPDIEKGVMREIDWARRTLEREDRVVWYLRYFQLLLMGRQAEKDNAEGFDEKPSNAVQVAYEKKVKQLSMKAGVSPEQIISAVADAGSGEFKTSMTHYMAMPVPAIQNHVFQYDLPKPLTAKFEKASEEWTDDRERVVDLDEGAEIVIDFGDGVAWSK